MSSFDITKVKKRTREDMDNQRHPPMTLENIKKMCSFLDEENPATYEIFLKHNPDLAENEIAFYQDIIATLKENNRLKAEIINERCRTFTEVLSLTTPATISINN